MTAEEASDAIGSLRGQYGLTLTITLFALVPYLLTTSAMNLLQHAIAADVGMSVSTLTIVQSMATAGYAFGALLAGDLSRRFPRRPTYLAMIAISGTGWVCVLSGLGPWAFGAGYVLIGLATGLLLIIALPPVFRNFPPSYLPFTAIFVNIGLFGGVAAGPMVAGLGLRLADWQAIFGTLAATALIALVLGWLVIKPEDATEPELPLDRPAIALSFGATVLPFGAIGLLGQVGFTSPWFYAPLTTGLICFAAIFIVEDRRLEPLIEVEKMVRTMPLIGTLIASFAGGIFLSVLSLAQLRMTSVWGYSEARVGLDLWPLVPGALAAAITLGVLFRTRYLPLLVLLGMLTMIGAGLLFMAAVSPERGATNHLTLGILGFGAGSTVSPALFLAGMSLPSATLGRVFAFVELVRSIGDFLIGPVLVQFATLIAPGAHAGEREIAITIGIAVALGVGTTMFCTVAFLSSYRSLARPDLEIWINGDKPAYPAPPGAAGSAE